MTPITLIIEGLYSYRSRQTIDFERLCTAKLFGIFGSVGSGKSSVLEAISYALYGETERLSKQDDRGYNMMNLQSNELHIDFEFSHPGPDDRYRFTVSNKRRKSDRTQTGTPKRLAYKWNGQEYLAIESSDAEKILGINYDNFKRTVIIPQGRFMEFLQLRPGERTAMLKELFGLHQFELYNQTASLDKANTEELNKLSGAMAAIGNIEKETILVAQEELNQLTQQAVVKENELTKAESELALQTVLKETAEKTAAHEKELAVLLSKKEAMEIRRTQLAEYERCSATFSAILATKTRNEKKLTELNQLVTSRGASVLKLQTEYEGHTATLTAVQAQLIHNEADATKAADMETVLAIQKHSASRSEAEQRISKGEVLLENVKKEASEKQIALLDIQNNIDASVAFRPKLQILQNNKTVLMQYAMAEEKVQNIKNQILDFEQQIATLQTENTETVSQLSISKDAFVDIASEISKIKQQIIALQTIKQQLAISENLSKMSGELQEGAECPVCGSTHHPHKISPSEISEDMKAADEEIKELELLSGALQRAEVSLQKNNAQIELLQTKHKTADKQIHTETIARNLILGQIDGPVLPLASVEKQIGELQLTEQALQKTEAEARTLAKEIAELKEKELNFSQRLHTLQNEFTVADTQIQSLTASIRGINLAEYLDKNEHVIHELRAELLRVIEVRNKAAEEAQRKIIELTADLSSLKGQLSSNADELKALQAEQTQLLDELTLKMTEENYTDSKQLQEILARQINIATERTSLDTFFTAVLFAQQQIQELRTKAGGTVFDPELFTTVQASVDTLKKAERELRDLISKKTVQLDDIQSRSLRYATALKDWEARSLRAENIKTILGLFKGSGFVNYVSTVYLQNLCTMANKRFKNLTNQKLQLELSSDNNFLIRDFLNNGETRSVKTLSGGQSFQAALSLALALSDSIQLHSGYTQNFFFLDEGFGSQDEDSLQMIFQTFENLKAENKTIGIISHVSALKEEIPSYVQIENSEEFGSRISIG